MILSDERPANGDFQSGRSNGSCLDFDEIVSGHTDLPEMFFELTRQLSEKLDIHKGVLILRQEQHKKLAAVCTWKDGFGREGLALNLPSNSSLFEKVAEHGQVYTENFCEAFTGNFFEQKLLLDDDSRSFALQPLKSNGHVVGLLGYSSLSSTAFTIFEEGVLDNAAQRLASVIEAKMYRR